MVVQICEARYHGVLPILPFLRHVKPLSDVGEIIANLQTEHAKLVVRVPIDTLQRLVCSQPAAKVLSSEIQSILRYRFAEGY